MYTVWQYKKNTDGVIVYPTAGQAKAVRLQIIEPTIIRVTASARTSYMQKGEVKEF